MKQAVSPVCGSAGVSDGMRQAAATSDRAAISIAHGGAAAFNASRPYVEQAYWSAHGRRLSAFPAAKHELGTGRDAHPKQGNNTDCVAASFGVRRANLQHILFTLCIAPSASIAHGILDDVRLDGRQELLGYYTVQEPADATLDSLLRLSSQQADLEWRGDWSAGFDPCSAVLSVRAAGSRILESEYPPARRSDTDVFVNAWAVRCKLAPALSLSAGRQVIQWGSGIYRSPSNPFFIDTGKTHPVRELYGKDFLRATWQFSDEWTLEALRNTGVGRRDGALEPYSPINAVRANWVGQSASGGLIASKGDEQRTRLGAYFTQTLSDAWLLYLDGDVQRGSRGWYPERQAASPLGWRYVRARENREPQHALLLGNAYTFESGWSLNIEYLFNEAGYDDAARAAFAQSKDAARAALRGNDAGLAAAAVPLLLTGLEPHLLTRSRQTLFGQLLRTEWGNRGDVALRAAHSLDDHGTSWSLSLTYNLSPSAELFSYAVRNVGGQDSEFRQLFDYSVIAGARWFF